MGGIAQCLSFCGWLISLVLVSSGFIHVVPCCQTPLFFKAEGCSIGCVTIFVRAIHPSVVIQIVSKSWLLSYEVSRIVKLIEAKSRMVLPGTVRVGWGR